MDLILWRHAEAEDAAPDLARNLTAHGREQARAVAAWLHTYQPPQVRILCSPANRTRQTADALGLPYDVRDDIAPNRSAGDLLRASGWPDGDGTVMLVGHKPSISQLAGTLLAGRPFPLSLCRAAVVWVTGDGHDGEPDVVLKAAIVPAMLMQR